MHQPRRSCLAFLSLIFLIAPARHAGEPLRINKSTTKVKLRDQSALVTLGVQNSASQKVRAHIEIEFIDPKGESCGKAERDLELPPGPAKIPFEVAMPKITPADLATVFWYRLLYKIAATSPSASPFEPVEGMLSVSEIAPEMFELQVALPVAAKLGAPFEVPIRAVQPVTSRPVSGVKIEATLDISDVDSPTPPKATATTDSRGYATVEFALPAKVDIDNPTIKITGKRGGYTATLDDEEIYTDHFARFLLNTDKPLYQPGQTLHARVLLLGPDRRAISDEPIELQIYDPEETLVFRSSLKTSRFGIASADWPIPANLRLGTFRLVADTGEEDNEERGSITVRVSRYELPNFSVTAKPDRPYYLPDQDATVEVRANYLFGQPVTRGHVRVVRENSREWNFRDQKWDIDEGEIYEGETDSSGRYVAKVDLSQERKDFLDNDYERFRDFKYTAYFTDPTSRRTEQRRFDLRLTKDPIHIYVISPGWPQSGNVADFYLSTFYADGTPAPCEVNIRSADTKVAGSGIVHPGRLLRTIRTNRYGVAKVFELAIPNDPTSDDEPSLVFRATDGKGAGGTHTEDFSSEDEPVLRVATDKTLYHPDDPIEVHLSSDEPDAMVEVQALADWKMVTSQFVRLHRGRGAVTFPPDDKFLGSVTIEAYELGLPPKDKFDETSAEGSHTVLFPHDISLQLDVRMSKATYRPGEEARADFHVNSADGGSAKSALGLVVVDRAVEERQRTDEELRSDSGFYAFRSYWEDDSSIGGISRADLDKIDLSKPLPEGLELVAEILLRQGANGARFESSSDAVPSLQKLFAAAIDPPLAPVVSALRLQAAQAKTPGGEAGIRRFLGTTQLATLRDPWGTPYRVTIQPSGANYQVKIESAGPDQEFDTRDDFVVASDNWPYFAEYSAAIQQAVYEYHDRTGGFIRDADALKKELLAKGVAFDSLRDPWGHAYRVEFGVERAFYTVEVTSAGPDGRFLKDDENSLDDVVVCRSLIEYFLDTRNKMNAALDRYYHDSGRFPENEKDLADAFHAGGVDWESQRDPWGHPFYATFRQEARYSDSVTVQSYAEYQAGQRVTIRPVTSEINFIDIRSGGADGKEGTSDDFNAAEFARAFYAQPAEARSSQGAAPILTGELGAIFGVVTDPTGAAVPGTNVIAQRNATEESFRAVTDGEGKYVLRNLKPGLYQVRIMATGFREHVFTEVPVGSSAVTQLNAVMEIGSVTQTVTVEAEAARVQTETATMRAVDVKTFGATSKSGQGPAAALSTPRLREYFPETLLWQPELVTDSRGTAHLSFPLADSITTWKLAVIASTQDGRIGTAEKDVRAFQPFFADQDLPQFLTVGDEIGLPVIVRNYLDRAEPVDLKLDPQPWMASLGPATQHTEVAANDSARVIFPMRAGTPVAGGKQSVTAIGKGAADAIERRTTVRPFGEERTASASQILSNSAVLNLAIPENSLPGSVEAELKVYPNLMAHVWEAIEAILQRPYGCGEQAISSTYPSILLLRYAKQTGRESSPETLRARHYAQMGYDRLVSYAAPGGGFTYWGRGDADLALTAYAVMFLNDAKDVIPVDETVIQRAQSWLLNQVNSNGYWAAVDYWNKTEDTRRSAMLTAYIVRVLALTKPGSGEDAADKQLALTSERELASALAWLGPRTEQQDEPYAIASYALALLDSGSAENRTAAIRVLQRLRSLAHSEGDTTYWSLEMNTPFYGWGRAGRLETTALVVEALERGTRIDPQADPSLIERGILFLLGNQDRYGIWYSTQATINVLRALAAAVSVPAPANSTGSDSARNSEATVLVDGKPAATVKLPPGNELSPPVTADLSKFLGSGDHRVEISRAPGAPEASVQLAAAYYVPWKDDPPREAMRREPKSSEALRLAVTYDKAKAKVGERINCAVKAERVDFRGYGMMLAEIGLPPGAEVDRASLDSAMTPSGWEISQFDVLPDRVIVYLWPRAGGTTFSFAFTTRFGIDAETARSVLYDYYNPDAQAVVAPTRFSVQ